MPFRNEIQSREFDKFKELSSGETGVRVVPYDSGSLIEGISFNKIDFAYAELSDTITYKNSGATVAVVTITYAAANKKDILSIERT